MKKKLVNLDAKLLTLTEGEDNSKMPTFRNMLQGMGNVKADTADDSRRIRRLLIKLREKGSPDLILESDDFSFLEKFFERNLNAWPSWAHGQILALFDEAEKVDQNS